MESRYIFTIVGLLAYALFMIIMGVKSYLSSKNTTENFYSADRGVNSFMLLCSTAISVFSGLTYYGYPASLYKDGIGFISGLGAFCAGPMFVILGYRLWLLGKEYGFQTPSDFLRTRYYSEGYGLFVALLLTIFIIPYVALQLITVGDGVSIATNNIIPYLLAVVIATITIGVHVFGGGMKGIAWMDTFNMILAFTALYAVVFTLIGRFDGGLKEAYQITAANAETAKILSTPGPRGTYNVAGIINNAFTGSVATIVWPHIFARTYIAKSKTNFKVMAWALPMFYGITFFGLAIIGVVLAPALLGPGFQPTDTVMPFLSTNFTTPIVSFISILCLFAFAISTSESLLLSATSMASKDIYVQWRFKLKNKEVDDRSVVRISRYVVIGMAIVIMIIVMTRPASITDYAYKLSSPFFAMIMPATIGGLFWKKGSKEGAITGTVAGVIVCFLLTFFIKGPFGLSNLVWGLIVGTVVYVVVSLVTKVPEEIVDKYITRVDNYICAGRDTSLITEKCILQSTINSSNE